MDKPVINYCAMCGQGISYSPIHIPVSRPEPVKDKPGVYDLQYAPVCLECIRGAIASIRAQVQGGALFPARVWEDLEIVEAHWTKEEAPKGFLRRLIDKLF